MPTDGSSSGESVSLGMDARRATRTAAPDFRVLIEPFALILRRVVPPVVVACHHCLPTSLFLSSMAERGLLHKHAPCHPTMSNVAWPGRVPGRRYLERMPVPPTLLPIEPVLPLLRQAPRRARTAAVLQAPPGAGKTTRVPLALLDEPWLAGRRIVMLEPRRLAARAAAGRMADTLGGDAGRNGRLPDPARDPGRPAHPDRGGHRGRPDPPAPVRPRAGGVRARDLRRVPRAKHPCRPGARAHAPVAQRSCATTFACS